MTKTNKTETAQIIADYKVMTKKNLPVDVIACTIAKAHPALTGDFYKEMVIELRPSKKPSPNDAFVADTLANPETWLKIAGMFDKKAASLSKTDKNFSALDTSIGALKKQAAERLANGSNKSAKEIYKETMAETSKITAREYYIQAAADLAEKMDKIHKKLHKLLGEGDETLNEMVNIAAEYGKQVDELAA